MGNCFSKKIDDKSFWRDLFSVHREVRFDLLPSSLELSRGENRFSTIERAFDLKSSLGRPGSMVLTNLRLFWSDDFDSALNVSIGLGCIQQDTVRVSRNLI